MMARGFKPVGWVAAVAGAALGCYMLSLNVAAERAELAKIERQIVLAKQEIRGLQTELGTRGRLQQLEQWNAEVLALSAPSASQFLESEIVLARFETREPTIEDRAKVQMAAAQTPVKPTPKLAPADYAAAAVLNAAEPKPLVHQASFVAPLKQVPLQKAAALVKAPEPRFAPAPKAAAAATKPAATAVAPAKKAAKPEAPVKLAEIRKPKRKAPVTSTSMLDDSLLKELSDTSRIEKADAGAR